MNLQEFLTDKCFESVDHGNLIGVLESPIIQAKRLRDFVDHRHHVFRHLLPQSSSRFLLNTPANVEDNGTSILHYILDNNVPNLFRFISGTSFRADWAKGKGSFSCWNRFEKCLSLARLDRLLHSGLITLANCSQLEFFDRLNAFLEKTFKYIYNIYIYIYFMNRFNVSFYFSHLWLQVLCRFRWGAIVLKFRRPRAWNSEMSV